MENSLTKLERTLLGIIVIMLIAFALLGIDNLSTRDKIGELSSKYDQKFNIMIRSHDSAVIAIQAQNRLDYDQAIKLGIAEREKQFKELQSQIRTSMSITQVQVPVPYPVQVEKMVLIDSSTGKFATWLKTPFSVRKQTKYNLFSATIGKDIFTIDTNQMSTDLKINIGLKKAGFLKRPDPVVEITSTNPDTKFNSVVNWNPPKERKAIKYGIAALAGAITALIIVSK